MTGLFNKKVFKFPEFRKIWKRKFTYETKADLWASNQLVGVEDIW